MNITAISDTHGKHRELELEGGDLLIHAGDIEAVDMPSLFDFVKWFDKQPYTYKVFIAGNHDFVLQNHPIQSEELIENFSVIYLKDEYRTIEHKGQLITMYGTPWSNQFYDWAFMDEPEVLERKNKDIANVDILISHSPPFGSQRAIVKRGTDEGVKGLPRGAKYIICGHIHEGYGTTYDAYHDTYVLNASVLDERYDLVNEPITFEFNKPIHKFNGGKGATLCHKCRVIIKEKLTDDLYCEKCKKKLAID